MAQPSFVSEPHVQYLAQILDEISRGLIQVPRFQRPFVWSDEQRLELLRSVRDGIPFGSIMVWRTALDGVACYDRIGPYRIASPSAGSKTLYFQYLLDGVQRLATLLDALYVPPPLADGEEIDARHKDILLNLRTRDFALKGDVTETDPHLPLPLLLDTVKLVRFQRGLTGERADEYIGTSEEVARAFREYKVSVIPIVTDDLTMATRTFKRINSGGQVMQVAHMVHALTWTADFDLNERLEELKDSVLKPEGWESLDDDHVLSACKARLSMSLYDSEEETFANKLRANPQALVDAVQDLAKAAHFLREECGLLALEMLPYQSQAVLLGTALGLSDPPARPELLVAWFWLITYGEVMAGLSGGRIAKMADELKKMAMDGVPRWPGTKRFERRPLPPTFDMRSVRSKAVALMLARLHPRAPEGNPTDVAVLLREKSAQQLLSPRRAAKKLCSAAANRFLVEPMLVAELLRKLQRQDADPLLLRSHLVSNLAHAHLVAGRMDDFLTQRQKDIEAAEAAFVQPFVALLPST